MKVFISFLFVLLFALPAAKAQDKADQQQIKKYFEGMRGSFILTDLQGKKQAVYNEKMLRERKPPCSTFKILNSLIGLETGVIPDENYVIKWDSLKRPIEAWNRDHSLKSALANSALWYYQELARRVGNEKMKKYVKAVHYGNEDISGGIDKFWLMNTLLISPLEQLNFMVKLYKNDLPFSKRTAGIVKNIMIYMQTDSTVLRGKTGSGSENNDSYSLGWYVGYVVTKGKPYFFVTNIEGFKGGPSGMKAREITISILKDKKLL